MDSTAEKDGEHLTVLVSITAFRNSTGAMTGFLAIGKDITSRRLRRMRSHKPPASWHARTSNLRKRDEALQAAQLKADFWHNEP